MKRDPLLDPLPKWEQRRRSLVAWWHRSRDRRRTAAKSLKSMGRRALTLAISLLGAMLVSYGVWQVYAPAGFVTGGILLWAVQWNYGEGGKG